MRTIILKACFAFVSAAAVCGTSPAFAKIDSTMRQHMFETDKAAALAGFNESQEKTCVKAFQSRYNSQYTLTGTLKFDESLSQVAYDELFWKGRGDMQRGLIFTGAVVDDKGTRQGHLICYYAMTDSRLDFQSAYVIPASPREMASLSQAPLMTLSSRE